MSDSRWALDISHYVFKNDNMQSETSDRVKINKITTLQLYNNENNFTCEYLGETKGKHNLAMTEPIFSYFHSWCFLLLLGVVRRLRHFPVKGNVSIFHSS